MNISIFGYRDIHIDPIEIITGFSQAKVNLATVDHIVSGGATGADSIAEKIAKEHNISTMIFKPDWNKHGRSAGVVRNTEIVKNSDIGFAIVNKPLPESKGTYDTYKKSQRAGKPVHLLVITK